MRLHHLTVTAFGPFAGTETLDFDELSEAGLFLLTGPTGAGKTTILDAVCFALYGSVPGVRGVKALKSHHAAEDVAPSVVLEFSVRDRRFVVRRTPEWTRPKRRGSGVITEKAAATLVELTHGEHFLSSRAQEVGHLVGDLVGMQATQFVQVAMLPQGDFQRFLRAGSQDRHAVLQHLFRTDRFARIEDWVHDHCRTLKDRSSEGAVAVQRILDTVADRAQVELPEALAGDALPTSAGEGTVLPWVQELLSRAERDFAESGAAHRRAGEMVATGQALLDRAVAQHTAHTRRTQALATLEVLHADEGTAEAAQQALAADDRAGRLVPLLRLLDDAERAARETTVVRDRALAALTACDLLVDGPVDSSTAAGLEHAERRVRERTTRLESLLPRQAALDEARRVLGEASRELAESEHTHARLTQRCQGLPDEISSLGASLSELQAVAAQAEALTPEVSAVTAQVEAARDAAAARAVLLVLEEACRDARDAAGSAREVMLDIRARRLAGIAAELAGRLDDGRACQVCGSTVHPSPAAPAPDAVTEKQQHDAEARFEERTEELAAASRRVSEAERRLEGLHERAGAMDLPAATSRLAAVQAALDTALEARERARDGEQRLDALRVEQGQVSEALRDLEGQRARLAEVVAAQERTSRDVTAEIAVVTGCEGGDLADAIRRQTHLLDLVGTARAATAAHDLALSRAGDLAGEAVRLADDQGFTGLEEVRGALLGADERETLETLMADRRERAGRAHGVLDDPVVAALADTPPPELGPLKDDLAAAESGLAEAARAHHQQEQVVTSLRTQLGRLERALDAWAPVRDEFVRADSMSRLVRGMGADNQLQMRLSAYVLATRLDQVVEASNERLAHMRDQRYLLQRTDRAARKGSQAGLGLEVLDQWTGEARDPATLSGGETFVVSLALALGLADVVTHEAGGTEVETLFVDEGFGSLDADTLDDVMDRLDDLRSGGRAVGVVSHVSELRDRIPSQVHVEKGRAGSHVVVRTMVG